MNISKNILQRTVSKNFQMAFFPKTQYSTSQNKPTHAATTTPPTVQKSLDPNGTKITVYDPQKHDLLGHHGTSYHNTMEILKTGFENRVFTHVSMDTVRNYAEQQARGQNIENSPPVVLTLIKEKGKDLQIDIHPFFETHYFTKEALPHIRVAGVRSFSEIDTLPKRDIDIILEKEDAKINKEGLLAGIKTASASLSAVGIVLTILTLTATPPPIG